MYSMDSNPYQVDSYHERILSVDDLSGKAPDVEEVVFHEIGNYVQALLGEEIDGMSVIEAYRSFREDLLDGEDDYRGRAEILRTLEENELDSEVDNCGQRLEMIRAGLESAEAYDKMYNGSETGNIEVEHLLSSFDSCENIEIDYSSNEDQLIDGGMELWTAINTFRKNTRDYVSKDAEIQIEVEEREDQISIRLSDEGEGIPEDERDNLFELDQNDTGLNTFSEIVAYNNGTVDYMEEENDWGIQMTLNKNGTQ